MRKIFKKEKGFTLIEIIAILVVIGIVAAIAITRYRNFNAYVISGTDTLKTHLRYAQTSAMNFNPAGGFANAPIPWGISGNSTSYWLFQGTNSAATANIMVLPDEAQYVNPNKTINLAAKQIQLSSFTVYFDNSGIPYSNSVSLTSNLTITVSPIGTGGTTNTVTIMPLTGYIP